MRFRKPYLLYIVDAQTTDESLGYHSLTRLGVKPDLHNFPLTDAYLYCIDSLEPHEDQPDHFTVINAGQLLVVAKGNIKDLIFELNQHAEIYGA